MLDDIVPGLQRQRFSKLALLAGGEIGLGIGQFTKQTPPVELSQQTTSSFTFAMDGLAGGTAFLLNQALRSTAAIFLRKTISKVLSFAASCPW